MINDDTIETIRCITEIFYKVKNFRYLLNYRQLFKEFKENGKIITALSLRRFVKNMNWIKNYSFIAPSYKLIWNTIEGIDVKPYYTKEDLEGLKNIIQTLPDEFPYLRGNKNDNNWLIRQDVYVDDLKKGNTIALDAIKKGAQSIAFIIPEKIEIEEKQLDSLLTNFPFENTELNFSHGRFTKKLLLSFIPTLPPTM